MNTSTPVMSRRPTTQSATRSGLEPPPETPTVPSDESLTSSTAQATSQGRAWGRGQGRGRGCGRGYAQPNTEGETAMPGPPVLEEHPIAPPGCPHAQKCHLSPAAEETAHLAIPRSNTKCPKPVVCISLNCI